MGGHCGAAWQGGVSEMRFIGFSFGLHEGFMWVGDDLGEGSDYDDGK